MTLILKVDFDRSGLPPVQYGNVAAETLEASRVREKGSDGVLELLVSAEGRASLSSNADRLTWNLLALDCSVAPRTPRLGNLLLKAQRTN